MYYGMAGEKSVLDRAFKTFWEAGGPKARGRVIKGILSADPSFDEVYMRLKAGRVYSGKVKRGILSRGRKGVRGLRHPYFIYVPRSYDPSRSYAVGVYLHGGTADPKFVKPVRWWRFAETVYRDDRITVFPVSWAGSMWWQYGQVENINGILDYLKRVYNIDENRVYMFGVSDGGTALYYFAAKSTTSWAAFVSAMGSPNVLNNPNVKVEGEIHAVNFFNKPFLVFNGGRDPLYPASSVRPFVELFRRLGCDILFRPKLSVGHSPGWWDSEEGEILRFMGEHPRQSFPGSLVWETEDTKRFGRAHWLVITRLGVVVGESTLNPWNIIYPGGSGGRRRTAFVRRRPSGRVVLQREGNRVDAYTQGVKEFKLLLSPEVFDFERSIRVFVNGAEVFSGRVVRDVSVLLKWAALDNDRAMLFGAELTIAVQ